MRNALMIDLHKIPVLQAIGLLGICGALAWLQPAFVHGDDTTASAEEEPGTSRLMEMRMPVHRPDRPPVLAIYVEDHGMRRGPTGPRVVMVLWESGRLIWSADREKGGPPYFATLVPWITSRALVSQLAEQKIFDDPVRDDLYFGPDATYTTLAICDGRHRLNMSSWHEHFERSGKSVALARGVTALNGRDLDELIAQEPEEYQRFRDVWKTVRSSLMSILPEAGMPTEQRGFTLERQTPPTNRGPQQKEQIGELFGQPVFRTDLRDFGTMKDKVGWAFMQPLVHHYHLQHHDELWPTEDEVAAAVTARKLRRQQKLEAEGEELTAELADVEKELAKPSVSDTEREELEKRKRILEIRLNPPEVKPSICRAILSQWKFQRHLYQNYGGGRLLFQQGGMEAFDAMHRWLRESEKAGDFKITDRELHTEFYAYFTTTKHGAFLQDPNEEKNAELRRLFLHPDWLQQSETEQR
jgi:hypothetical protein